jgi:phosphoribosylamine--glycine ligase
MKVLVVGHGAREHAITKKLAEEKLEIFSIMGKNNPGIRNLSKRTKVVDINNFENYREFKEMDLAFVGPEDPLAHGVSDYLWNLGVPVVGPKKEQAKLEWSKAFTREILNKYNIPGNPDYKICKNKEDINEFLRTHKEVAVKPDVLTGGKGVKISGEHLQKFSEIENYALERIQMDGLVVLEEKLAGKEFTVQAFTDGKNVEVMPLVRDFKRAYDGDKGPNTGSMGSFSCPDYGMPDLTDQVVEEGIRIMRKTVEVIGRDFNPFKGVLYGGFMSTPDDVFLIEYNVRFGDPEAINVLSLLENPLSEVGFRIAHGDLNKVTFSNEATVCVYLVPEGYPVNPVKGESIQVGKMDYSELYYASVNEENGLIRTTGSRSIALLGKGATVGEAREKVYSDVSKVSGKLYYRTDIAKNI